MSLENADRRSLEEVALAVAGAAAGSRGVEESHTAIVAQCADREAVSHLAVGRGDAVPRAPVIHLEDEIMKGEFHGGGLAINSVTVNTEC